MTRDPSDRRPAAPAQPAADRPDRQTPPIARPEAPDGPDVSDKPEAAAGHYGPGYGDPTRHLGGSPPGRDAKQPPSGASGEPGSVARTDATGGTGGRDPGAGKRR